ncbi:hypothetical protein [uncultured Sphingomonas sp.]|uniref:hypothetical protein n=1 Tax=uncultured Sphingomonas sp. TaxID=158754 RepID=UPI0025F594F8|nr:hypothetical protein [uncultured Sphingomonas sp.]
MGGLMLQAAAVATLLLAGVPDVASITGSPLSKAERRAWSVAKKADRRLQARLALNPPVEKRARFYALFCDQHVSFIKGTLVEVGHGNLSLYPDRQGVRVSTADKKAGIYFVKANEFPPYLSPPGVEPPVVGRAPSRERPIVFIGLDANTGRPLNGLGSRPSPSAMTDKRNYC